MRPFFFQSTSSKFKNATPGDLFYESTTSHVEPRVLKFIELKEKTVVFNVLGSCESFEASADDRYGDYPPLSRRHRIKIHDRVSALREELRKFEFLQKKIDQFVMEDVE